MAPPTEQLKQALSGLQGQIKDNKTTVAAVAGGIAAVAAGTYIYRRAKLAAVPKSGPYTADTLPAGAYDAVIVGAGPSGSTCAHFMAKEGAKVAMLDKATFPRGKRGATARSPLFHSPPAWQCDSVSLDIKIGSVALIIVARG